MTSLTRKRIIKFLPLVQTFHKQLVNKCPPFRLIVSAIDTPTSNIAKFLVPILKPLTTKDYTLKDTFEFSREILNQTPNLFMESLDVDSLFTNIPLDETISIILEKLSSENETAHNLNKDLFKCLLTLATKESYFQPYMIICFFVRQLFVLVLKIFQFLLKVHVSSNLRLRKVF